MSLYSFLSICISLNATIIVALKLPVDSYRERVRAFIHIIIVLIVFFIQKFKIKKGVK